MILYKICWYSGLGDAVPVLMFLYYMVAMNLSLAVFNLLRCRRLTAAASLCCFAAEALFLRLMKYERYIMLTVLGFVFLGLLDIPLSWLCKRHVAADAAPDRLCGAALGVLICRKF